jgi:Glutaredoxin-like domain (DUF836)
MFWSRWRAWWRRQQLPAPDVVLYTRQGCHLCEDAWGELAAARQRYGFRLSLVDVDSDPRLVTEHGEHVPVVTVNGLVRFRGRVNRVLLERLLRALQSGAAS